jgi:PKD repeat protein
MTLPSSSLYPDSIDSDSNLFLVHDSLRVLLAEDYTPGDTIITVSGDTSRFPPTGLITLTDQCSELSLRAISFYYGIVTETTFEELEILPGFTDVPKTKNITDITENVMAEHHDHIKNAIIAIEKFAGVKGTTDVVPLGDTMEGRTNFLQNLVLRPRAWFTSNKRVGVVPLDITFDDQSFRKPTYWKWCFGDNGTSSVISIPSVSEIVPSGISCVIDVDGGTVEKTYYTPGFYNVSLTVSNTFGTDTLVLENMINARAQAPDTATLDFFDLSSTNQVFEPDASLATGGVLKSKINTVVNIEVNNNGAHPSDPIVQYIWKLGDTLQHFNSAQTQAMYSTGGLYDVKVRINATSGAYRTTIVPDAVDVIESNNVWMSLFPTTTYQATKTAKTYEFNILGEVFKANNRNASPNITRDYGFLSGVPQENQQKKEFLRNAGFSAKNTTDSGDRGTAYMYWASGSSAAWAGQTVNIMEYEGFSDCYAGSSNCNATATSSFSRAWNWVSLNTPQIVYFLLGNTDATPDVNSSTNQDNTQMSLTDLSTTTTVFTSSNYTNGAVELMNNVDNGANGNFSVYRSAWFNSTGFIARNDANGTFFRIKSFYQTQGVLSDLVQGIQKINDMPGSTKLEGQLVPLISGVYFFNNTGEVLAYSPTSSTWSVGGPGIGSLAWSALYDSSVVSYADPTLPGISGISFDDPSQKLIAASDSNTLAYLSFDYSVNTFIKFNETSKTFSSLPARPSGEQWLLGVY